jgi:pilus assembly protein Flp/PilA
VNITRILRRLLLDRSGATAIEYDLIAALIAIACVVAWTQVGTDLSSTFATVAADL